MEIKFIENELNDLCKCPTLIQRSNHAPQILVRAKFLEQPERMLQAHTLYLCNNTKTALKCLSFCKNDSASLLLFQPDLLRYLKDFPIKFNIFLVPDSVSIAQVSEHLNHLFESRSELEACIQEIDEAFFSGDNLQYLLEVAGEVLGNPTWVTGLNYDYLTTPYPPLIDDAVFQNELRMAHVSDEDIAILRKIGIPEMLNQQSSPSVITVGHLDMNMIIEPIRIKGIVVGYTHILEQNRAFQPSDFEIVTHLSKIISAELQKAPYFGSQKGIAFSYFLLDLLQNKMNNEKNIAKHLHALGYEVYSFNYLLHLALPSSNIVSTAKNNIAESMNSFLPNSIYAVLDNCIIFLISLSSPDLMHQINQMHLNSYLTTNALKLGISACFQSLLEVPAFYPTAELSVRIGQQVDPNQRIFHYHDYAVYHLFDIISSPLPFYASAHSALPKLFQHDQEYHTDYVLTLRVYLSCAQDINRAADQLSVHKNTLRYRLEKIKALTGLDLESGAENALLLLGILYNRYQSINQKGNGQSTGFLWDLQDKPTFSEQT